MYTNHFVGFFQTYRQMRDVCRLVVAMALAAIVLPLGGCWGYAGGEGTVDISSSKAASYANANPDFAKAAATRGKGVTDKAEKSRRK